MITAGLFEFGLGGGDGLADSISNKFLGKQLLENRSWVEPDFWVQDKVVFRSSSMSWKGKQTTDYRKQDSYVHRDLDATGW